MSDRLEALRSKLPNEALSIIRSYDSHLFADWIREIKFEEFPCQVCKRLTNFNVWLPLARELERRMNHNRSLGRDGGVWLPVSYSINTWIMIFEEEIDYLPDWVKEQYLAERRESRGSCVSCIEL